MSPGDRGKIKLGILLIMPLLGWLLAVKQSEQLAGNKWQALIGLMQQTITKPILISGLITGLIIAGGMIWLIETVGKIEFEGGYYNKFLRGITIASSNQLANMTRSRNGLRKNIEQLPIKQITVAGVPMPHEIENMHLLVAGSTGAGKSVLIREIVYKALLRGDKLVIADPDGDMLSKFWRNGDVILNPYDARTAGWSFYNEIRHEYDYKRFALSLVPRGRTPEAEEWAGYARLLLRETARKLQIKNKGTMRELFHWTTIADPEELKQFLTGTDAESLFVGATKALASARFVLADKLQEQVNMPIGQFSIRDWLEKKERGNLYITWREDMAESLKPLISSWIDVLCTSILSLQDDETRKVWLILDELASLEKLASLEGALTKGRKKGLRVVGGLQSTSQLEALYGKEESQTLRACFRSLVVLGGAKTDAKTCEDMSKSLGEHEVERENYSKNSSSKNSSTSISKERVVEKIVLASQIASLPKLVGYLAYGGNWPIAKIKLQILNFVNKVPGFITRE